MLLRTKHEKLLSTLNQLTPNIHRYLCCMLHKQSETRFVVTQLDRISFSAVIYIYLGHSSEID